MTQTGKTTSMLCCCLAFVLLFVSSSASAQNVTVVLENSAPVNTNFSTFSWLLSMTNVSAEINSRSSLTILVPDNSALDSFVSTNLEGMHIRAVGDFCRYHILLQYLDIQEIMQMTNQSGLLIATLYQTTGRAQGVDGFVNMTFGNDIQFGLPPPNTAASSMSTVLNNFVRYPYNMSFMMISKPLMPLKLGLTNRPDHFPSVPNALFRANIYKTFLKLLQDTGVQSTIEDIEHQPFTDGVTIFAPTDSAFQSLPSGVLAALSNAQKLSLVQYHVVPGFFTFGSLRTRTSPLPTLASRATPGKFVVNATNNGPSGGLLIETGVSSGNAIATLMEDDPVGVYAVDAVLLPPEIFPLNSSPPATSPSLAPTSSPHPNAPPPSSSSSSSAPAPSGTPPPQPPPKETSSPPPRAAAAAPSPPPPSSSSSAGGAGGGSSSSSSSSSSISQPPAEAPDAGTSDSFPIGFNGNALVIVMLFALLVIL